MKIFFNNKYQYTPPMLLRKCGYAQIVNRQGEISFARRFGMQQYPRFHAYVEKTTEAFQVNLHLDQKQPSYGGHTAHSGEYQGELVEKEGARIKQVIEGLKFS